jgi:hypothetical protein
MIPMVGSLFRRIRRNPDPEALKVRQDVCGHFPIISEHWLAFFARAPRFAR